MTVLPETEMLRGLIEAKAIEARQDHSGQIELSIAISLKRIADALETGNGLKFIDGAAKMDGAGLQDFLKAVADRVTRPFKGDQ